MAVSGANASPAAVHVAAFFGSYLTGCKGASPNTVRSYRDAVAQFLEYASASSGTAVESLRMEHVGPDVVEAFLSHLGEVRGVGAPTRNQRLAAIHSLFRHIQGHDLARAETCMRVPAIEKKRCAPPTVGHLTIEGMRAVPSMPDASTRPGLKDLALLATLYESAARVQGIIDVDASDLAMGSTLPTLHGKGGKTRTVPLGKETAAMLERHMRELSISGDAPLFPGRHGRMSRSGVQYVVAKYSGAAREAGHGGIPRKTSPHQWRHSRAMHLLEAGVNLVYICDLLGHASVTTTEIYAKANPEMRRKAIEGRSAKIAPVNAYSEDEREDLLGWPKSRDW